MADRCKRCDREKATDLQQKCLRDSGAITDTACYGRGHCDGRVEPVDWYDRCQRIRAVLENKSGERAPTVIAMALAVCNGEA